MYDGESQIDDSCREPIKSATPRRVRFGVTVLVGLAACVWMGFGTQNTTKSEVKTVEGEIRARSFVVVDDDGKERANFGIQSDGRPRIVVWDEDKTIAAVLGVNRAGALYVGFEKAAERPIAVLGLLSSQSPVFVMRGPNGKRRLIMAARENGSVSIGLYDPEQRERCTLAVGKTGTPQVILKDDKGEVRVRLMLDPDGNPALVLLDKNGHECVVLQVNGQGEPDAALLKGDGKPIWSARSD